MKIIAPVLLAFVLAGCESGESGGAQAKPATTPTQWLVHPKARVPDVFSNSGKDAEKHFVSHGYYEQRGSESSSASWEGAAHYSYLSRRGICLGRIENADFSISPTGRYAAITSNNGRTLKVYDSRTNRYFLKALPPAVMRDYQWFGKAHGLELDLTHKPGVLRIVFPEKALEPM